MNPANLVAQLELQQGAVVADFGCGGGYFCIPAAQAVGSSGTVYAVDILQERLTATQSAARQMGLRNLMSVHADLEQELDGIPAVSCDWVFMGNVLYKTTGRERLFVHAYRILKTGGRVLTMSWRREAGLFGPPQDRRVSLKELVDLGEASGFRKERELDADDFHYAVVFVK